MSFALIAALSFRVIRIYQVFDYRSFIKEIDGPLWMVFDVVYFLFMIFCIAVMISATGTVVEQNLGWSYWIGVIPIVGMIGVLNLFGDRLIERFETVGTLILYVSYLIFSILIISGKSENIKSVFEAANASFVPDISIVKALWSGVLYCGYNLVIMPASFFTIKRQTKRRESVCSAIIGRLIMMLPWFMTYFSILCFYPREEVLTAPIPWIVMMDDASDSGVKLIFSIILGWKLIQTSTGIIHAVIERINKGLLDIKGKPQTGFQKVAITVGILISSICISGVGIVNRIGVVYDWLAYIFLAVYVVPLFTVGGYKIYKNRKNIK